MRARRNNKLKSVNEGLHLLTEETKKLVARIPHARELGALGERMDKADELSEDLLDDLSRVKALLSAANGHGNPEDLTWVADVAERLSKEALTHFDQLNTELILLFQGLHLERAHLAERENSGRAGGAK
jgi:hypothetical protein